MATTKLQDHIKLLTDNIGWRLQKLQGVLGDGTGSSKCGYGVEQQIAEIATPGTSGLSGVIDVEYMQGVLLPSVADQGRRTFQDPQNFGAYSATGHPVATLFSAEIGAIENLLKNYRDANKVIQSSSLNVLADYTNSTFANRIFYSPEFAFLARSLGKSIAGGAVRGPNWWHLADITLPGTISAENTEITSFTVTAIPGSSLTYAGLFGSGLDKFYVGQLLELVYVGSGSLTIGTNDASIEVLFSDPDGTARTVTLAIPVGTYSAGAMISTADSRTIDAQAKLFAGFRTSVTADSWTTTGKYARVSGGNGTNRGNLQSKVFAIRCKDVALSA